MSNLHVEIDRHITPIICLLSTVVAEAAKSWRGQHFWLTDDRLLLAGTTEGLVGVGGVPLLQGGPGAQPAGKC
jgi:hypothetical protein